MFSEAINARGNSLTLTEQVLRQNGFQTEAEAIWAIRESGKLGRLYAISLAQKHPKVDAETHNDQGTADIVLSLGTDRAIDKTVHRTRRAWCGYRGFTILGYRTGIGRQIMKRIFTERFFRLNANDQVAVVEAVLRDIETNYGRYITPDDENRARQRAERIRKKAAKCGVL